jgi:hypothetical protein
VNERLDRILARGGRLEALRDAKRAVREAAAQPEALTSDEAEAAREIKFVIDRLIWDSLGVRTDE